jgi:predicted transposase YbfD/YdcC
LDLIDIRGDAAAIGAMGCQRTTAEKIRDKKAHYLLAVKENQPALYQDIGEYFEYLEEPGC